MKINEKNRHLRHIRLYWNPTRNMWGYAFITPDRREIQSSFSFDTAKEAQNAGLRDYLKRLNKEDEIHVPAQ